MTLIYLFSLVIFALLFNKFLIKKNILLSETGDIHQKFSSTSKVPLSGGIFIFLGYFYFINKNIYSFLFFSFMILILGIFSDIKVIKSASFRFLSQILIVLIFIVFNDVQINDTRVILLDKILNYQILNYFFVSFCILVVINGSNFIDGMNTLTIGYYLLIGIVIFFLNLNENIIIQEISMIYILVLLALVFALNISNKMYLGDAGSYLMGFSFSIFLIDTYNLNQNISPFFIILLLWYPCFENLFSILRKKTFDYSPMSPDDNHLHQLIFFYIKKKYKLKLFSANVLTAQILNFYNLIIFCIGANFMSKTDIQAILILFSIIFYSFVYFKLYVFKNN